MSNELTNTFVTLCCSFLQPKAIYMRQWKDKERKRKNASAQRLPLIDQLLMVLMRLKVCNNLLLQSLCCSFYSVFHASKIHTTMVTVTLAGSLVFNLLHCLEYFMP